jgi:hypothetical protein
MRGVEFASQPDSGQQSNALIEDCCAAASRAQIATGQSSGQVNINQLL